MSVAIRRDVPRRLAGIIERAIDPDAERRFESVDELATALGTLQPRRAVIPLRYAIAIAAALGVGGLLLSRTSTECQVAPMAPRLPCFR